MSRNFSEIFWEICGFISEQIWNNTIAISGRSPAHESNKKIISSGDVNEKEELQKHFLQILSFENL